MPARFESDLSVAILAGGHSRRMGTPKPLLRLGSMTVVERVIAAAAPLGAPVALIAAAPPRPGSGEDSHPAAPPSAGPSLSGFLRSLGLPVFEDLEPDRGPLGGLETAFERTESADILLLACDLPFVTTAFLQFLLGHRPLSADVLVPESTAGPEPLCAVYSRPCRDALSVALKGPNLSIRRFVDGLDARLLQSSEYEHLDPEAVLFTNLNTPRDYKLAQDLWRRLEREL